MVRAWVTGLKNRYYSQRNSAESLSPNSWIRPISTAYRRFCWEFSKTREQKPESAGFGFGSLRISGTICTCMTFICRTFFSSFLFLFIYLRETPTTLERAGQKNQSCSHHLFTNPNLIGSSLPILSSGSEQNREQKTKDIIRRPKINHYIIIHNFSKLTWSRSSFHNSSWSFLVSFWFVT
jgi:hypothetical protein